MPHEEKTPAQWEAEMDANTLSEAEVIKGDFKRFNAAKKAAGILKAEAEAKVKGFKVIESISTKSK